MYRKDTREKLIRLHFYFVAWFTLLIRLRRRIGLPFEGCQAGMIASSPGLCRSARGISIEDHRAPGA